MYVAVNVVSAVCGNLFFNQLGFHITIHIGKQMSCCHSTDSHLQAILHALLIKKSVKFDLETCHYLTTSHYLNSLLYIYIWNFLFTTYKARRKLSMINEDVTHPNSIILPMIKTRLFWPKVTRMRQMSLIHFASMILYVCQIGCYFVQGEMS